MTPEITIISMSIPCLHTQNVLLYDIECSPHTYPKSYKMRAWELGNAITGNKHPQIIETTYFAVTGLSVT